MKRILHWLAHRLSWNYGVSKSFWDGDRLMMAFVCSGCGAVSGVHEVPPSLYRQYR